MSRGRAEGIWTQCVGHGGHGGRGNHVAIQEPISKRVWLVGGLVTRGQISDQIRELTFMAPPLKILALESTAKNIQKLAPQIEELPKKDPLRRSVEAKAQRKYKIT